MVPVSMTEWPQTWISMLQQFQKQIRGWGAIKKFLVWPCSVQNKIKIVFAFCSSKAQNTTCALWLLGYKYFVHFSVWTKCPSDGVENANTRTAHKFLKNFSNDTDVTQQKLFHCSLFRMKCDFESEQQNMQWNEQIGQIVISLHCITPFFPCRMETTVDC